MDLKELLNYVEYGQISLLQVFLRLSIASFSGFIISRIYKLYHRDDLANREMTHTLIFLTIIIASAMMIIGNNLASAFGLVGAVSIIRFRTVVKSSRDMSFVLFAVVAGLSCGLGYLFLALSGLIFTAMVMVGVFFVPRKAYESGYENYSIKIGFKGSLLSRSEIESILGEETYSFIFDTMKIDGERVSFTYTLSLKSIEVIEKIIEAIEALSQLDKPKILFTRMD